MRGRVFTTGEVASICGVSSDTVSRWFDMGQIKGYRLGPGGDRRIPYESLRAFMIAHGIPLERLETSETKILVVDDDPFYLDIIPDAIAKKADKDKEILVLTASTGFDAGALIVEHNPNLVIMDIHLSDIDGRKVCERLKNRHETKYARVLGISGLIDESEVNKLRDYGFDDFLKKPFSLDELVKKVFHLLSLPPTSVSRPKSTGT
ncbi:MAG TPA: response regulator [Candidatus Hydrogenedens sp.]|nr:response regulator [Candidatus Hydrogenedens sp.]HOL19152.1 response regulator [Candidatus Hydrogenedens sp.]HPP58794.1 response regulator [Candidatus Hydrogenedens sp.]